MWLFVYLSLPESGKPEYPEKTSRQHPHMASTPGYEPGSHWWEASALTTVPSLIPNPQVEVFDTTYQNYDLCE